MDVSYQLYTPATLPSSYKSLVATEKEAIWPPKLVWMLWKEKKSPCY